MHKSEEDNLKILCQTALTLGASAACIIESKLITLQDDFAKFCKGPPQCPNFGLACSCPPYVGGPQEFRKWQAESRYAIVVRIDIPSTVLFSAEYREVGQLLHETVAAIEKEAVRIGYTGSKSFAGGSCKKIFCHDHPNCRLLTEQGECRHPDVARPSMSGFGIDVTKLMQTAGWQIKKITSESSSDADSMSWVAGLVLLK
jgi:predicted metal-binding protein